MKKLETFRVGDVLSEFFVTIFALLWVFQQFEFHEDCRFSLFSVILFNVSQKLSRLLLHALKISTERVTAFDTEKKYLQDFLFLRKHYLQKEKCFIKVYICMRI